MEEHCNKTLNQFKMDFNNDIIKLKKNIMQAKVQTINNLSKKIKILKDRKGNTEQQEKNSRKLDSLVTEIMILKQIKFDELGKFALRNFEKAENILNSPQPTKNRAMARLVLHKSLKANFDNIKKKFTHISVDDLLEQNRKKIMKKKRKEKIKLIQKKKLAKHKTETTDSEHNTFNIEPKITQNDKTSKVKNVQIEDYKHRVQPLNTSDVVSTSEFKVETVIEETTEINRLQCENSTDEDSVHSEEHIENKSLIERPSPKLTAFSLKRKRLLEPENNCDEKKKMLIDADVLPANVSIPKTVDSFFTTNSGNNYMTSALPRVIPVAKSILNGDGNRKMRRAALFGREMEFETRKPIIEKNKNFISNRNNKNFETKMRINEFKVPQNQSQDKREEKELIKEKLHPSWEAKKQQSSILPFKGNKIVFDN